MSDKHVYGSGRILAHTFQKHNVFYTQKQPMTLQESRYHMQYIGSSSTPSEIELKSGGAAIPVTDDNKNEYLALLEAHLLSRWRAGVEEQLISRYESRVGRLAGTTSRAAGSEFVFADRSEAVVKRCQRELILRPRRVVLKPSWSPGGQNPSFRAQGSAA
jgi:hypothetical protein